MAEEESLTFYKKIKIIMEWAVPIIRAFQEEFGKDRVNAVLKSIQDKELQEAEGADFPDPDFELVPQKVDFFAAGGALDYEILDNNDESLDFRITRCRYAELMKELEATDLGSLFICMPDFADALRSGMRLDRTLTIMETAPYCDFHLSKR